MQLGGKNGILFWNYHFLVNLNAIFLQIRPPTSDDFVPHHFLLNKIFDWTTKNSQKWPKTSFFGKTQF